MVKIKIFTEKHQNVKTDKYLKIQMAAYYQRTQVAQNELSVETLKEENKKNMLKQDIK